MRPLNGIFYRIVFKRYADEILKGVISKQGRFHHDGEAAFYCSPSAEGASIAIDRYVQPDDPERVLVALELNDFNVVDIRPQRIAQTIKHYPSLKDAEINAAIPWLEDSEQGIRPASWIASDAARATGADGMLYSSRRAPERWHVVLFKWDERRIKVLSQSPWHHK